jgi:cytochrome oxidase Cu insertion factor (SCO1/SenC/PrrC family)
MQAHLLRLLAIATLLWSPAAPAAAQAPVATTAFAGTTADGRVYELAQRRGRVVMLVLWRTDCAVCLSKMPELRANAAGWAGKPFDLVTVNLDPKREDALAYEAALRQTGASRLPMWTLWHGNTRLPAEWQQPARLPVLLLIDAEGRLVKRHEGRVPPEAWDEVAELLP